MQRRSVSKRGSARAFNRTDRKTHPFNVRIRRGGWRL